MSEYNCPRCGINFNQKNDIRRHINRKNLCKPSLLDLIPKDFETQILNKEKITKYTCICGISFFNINSLNNHEQTICDKFKIEKLEKELEKAKASSSSTTNITNNHIQNQNNIIINITPYNDPNLDNAEKYYLAALKKMFMSVPYIIEQIHFNTDFPENHNLCIRNYRTKLAKVFNGREWKTMDEDRLIDELIDTYERLLEDWAEDNPKRMQYIEKYKEIKERDGKSKVYKDLKDEVKKLIYDKRDMIRETKVSKIKN